MPNIYIPASVEDAKASLDGLSALITAKRWERAAIVYAFTRSDIGGGSRRNRVVSTQLPCREFAETMGIRGLGEKQVREYRKAWESAAAEIGSDEMLAIQPGDAIDLPDLPWKDHFGEPTKEVQERVARSYIAANPNVAVEAIKALPNVAEAVTTAIASDTTLREDVDRKAFHGKIGIPDRGRVAPGMVVPTDLNRDLSDTLSRLGTLLRKEDNGEFKANGLNESWLRVMGLQLTERATTGKADDDLFDQIDTLLASSRGAA